MLSEVLSVRVPCQLKELLKSVEDIYDRRRNIVGFLWRRARYYYNVVEKGLLVGGFGVLCGFRCSLVL